MSEPGMLQAPRRAALTFIFVTVVLDMLALGMVVPVLPHLIEDFLGGDIPRAAQLVGFFGTVWAVMQFFSMPVMGALSDRFGRRPVILLSNFGLGLDYVLMALAPTLSWLFVGRLISGVTAASISTSMAYVADVTPPERRAQSFGFVGVAFGLGFVLGPAIGGLLGSVDPRLPFWAAACASLLNAAYGFFILPESLPREKRRAFEWRRANPLGSLRFLRAHREVFALGRRSVPEQPDACGAACRLRALCRLPLRLGRKSGRTRVGGRRDFLGPGAGGARGAAGASFRRTSRHDRWAARRHRGVHAVRICTDWPVVRCGHPDRRAVGSRRPSVAGNHDARGRQCLPRVNCRERWAVSLALPR